MIDAAGFGRLQPALLSGIPPVSGIWAQVKVQAVRLNPGKWFYFDLGSYKNIP
jgi:hypothetical protein